MLLYGAHFLVPGTSETTGRTVRESCTAPWLERALQENSLATTLGKTRGEDDHESRPVYKYEVSLYPLFPCPAKLSSSSVSRPTG